jgi:hypothetical protein
MSSALQGSPNATWLDEELRKEKALVADLRSTVDGQQVVLKDQAQRILALEDRLAKLQGQLLRIPNVEEALAHTRDEVVLMVSELRQEQQKREAEFLRNRRTEREQDVRAIQEIQEGLKRFDPLEQAVATQQVEDRRLNESVLRAQQGLDDLLKRLLQREETARQLADRIEHNTVKLGQAEMGVEESRRALQEHVSRLLLLESAAPRVQQQIGELQTMRSELTKQQDEMLENQRRGDRDRVQAMTEWGRRLEGYAHQLDVWAEQLRFYADQHEKTRRVLREIQELSQQVSQQQDQLKQTQRIAEEQIRRELREWRADSDRRWTQNAEREVKAQEAQSQRDDGQEQRLTQLELLRQDDLAVVKDLQEHVAALHGEYLGEFRRLRLAQLLVVRMQAQSAAEVLAEMSGTLGEGEA